MRLQTFFLNPLALTGYVLPCVGAHKESKADRIADLHKNFEPHTWEQQIVNRMVCCVHKHIIRQVQTNFSR